MQTTRMIPAMLLFALLALTPLNAAEVGGWHTSYKAATAAAKKQKRLILADFTGSDWCSWCIKLKKEVFNTPEFKKWAAENVVLLELDYPKKKKQDAELKKQNAKLAKKYGIRAYPTILFLDADGKKVAKMSYMKGGPKPWIAKAEEILKKHKG